MPQVSPEKSCQLPNLLPTAGGIGTLQLKKEGTVDEISDEEFKATKATAQGGKTTETYYSS